MRLTTLRRRPATMDRMEGGYEECMKWAWDGKQSCKEVVSLLNGWAAADESYAAALMRVAKAHPLPESEQGTTFNKAWSAVKMLLEHQSINMTQLAKQRKEESKRSLDFRHNQSDLKRKIEGKVKVLRSTLKDAENDHNGVMKKYTASCKAAESSITARDKGKERAKSTDKAQGKVAKAMQDCLELNTKYAPGKKERARARDRDSEKAARACEKVARACERVMHA